MFAMPRRQQEAAQPLPPAKSISRTPINKVDPTSGKPIVEGLVSTYKGYTIGHCCEVSRQTWEALGVPEKEAAIRRFLE
jgi:hypothetical protein